MRTNTIGLITFMSSISFLAACKVGSTITRNKNTNAMVERNTSVMREQTCEPKQEIKPEDVAGTQVIGLNSVDLASVNDAISTVLKAAPKIVVDTFLARGPKDGRATGYVAIHGRYDASLCKSRTDGDTTVNGANNSGAAACWTVDKGRHVIRIFALPGANADIIKKLIHNYLLVELGFLYDDYMMYLAGQDLEKLTGKDPKASQINAAGVKAKIIEYVAFRDALAAELMAKDTEKKDEQTLKNLKSLFMSESLDSYYCSQATRSDFETKIPGSFKIFSEHAASFFGK
jgi:hypothetical protein